MEILLEIKQIEEQAQEIIEKSNDSAKEIIKEARQKAARMIDEAADNSRMMSLRLVSIAEEEAAKAIAKQRDVLDRECTEIKRLASKNTDAAVSYIMERIVKTGGCS